MTQLVLLLLIVSVLTIDPTFDFVDQTDYYTEKLGKAPNFYTETGYITIPSFDDPQVVGQTFYHLFLKDGTKSLDEINQADIFALWLNGGPGCSSQFGNFQEIGPIIVKKADKSYTVELRGDYSWNKLTHQIFVDQPFNVGLSFSKSKDLVKNTDTAAKYLVIFLETFFKNRPQLQKLDFYISGESFAGHYIPATAIQILKTSKTINLKGVAIGDGWTGPFQQFSYYGSYLYSIGVIDDKRRDQMRDEIAAGQSALLSGDMAAASQLFEKLTEVGPSLGDMNIYNFLQYGGQDVEDESYIQFIQDSFKQFKVPEAITQYHGCNDDIYKYFELDIPTSREADIAELLNQGLRVLLFNGQLDYIVNTPGAINWINQLKWTHINEWKSTTKKSFTAKNVLGTEETCGTIRYFDNFYFATVYRAGHMVPTDNPPAAYKMIQNFYTNAQW